MAKVLAIEAFDVRKHVKNNHYLSILSAESLFILKN